MKKLLCLLSFAALLMSSCSSGDSSSTPATETDVLVTKTVESYSNGDPSITTNFTYNGKKIVGVSDSDGYYDQFFYTGNLITNVKHYDSDDILQEEETFTYNSSGDLVTYLIVESQLDNGHKETYVHNSNGTISVSSYSGSATVQNNLSTTGLVYFVNGEVSKYETSIGASLESTTLYTYDTKNNPYKNITGYDKIAFIDSESNGFSHNVLTQNMNSTGFDESYTSVYTYNTLNYPLTQVETDNSDGSTTSTQYTYN